MADRTDRFEGSPDAQKRFDAASGASSLKRETALLSSSAFWGWLIARDKPLVRDRYPDAVKLKEFLERVARRDPEAMELYQAAGVDTSDWDEEHLNTGKLLRYLALSAERKGAEAFSEIIAPLGLSGETADLLTDPDVSLREIQRQIDWISSEEGTADGRRRLEYEKTMDIHPARIYALEDFLTRVRREDPEALELYDALVDPHLTPPLETTFFGLTYTNTALLNHISGSLAVLPEQKQAELRDALAARGVDRATTELMLKDPAALVKEMEKLRLERTIAPLIVDPVGNAPNIGSGPKDAQMWAMLFSDGVNALYASAWRYDEELFRYAHGASTPLEAVFQEIYPDREKLRDALSEGALRPAPDTFGSRTRRILGMGDVVSSVDFFLQDVDRNFEAGASLLATLEAPAGMELVASLLAPEYSAPAPGPNLAREGAPPQQDHENAVSAREDFMAEVRALVDASNVAVNA